MLIIEIKDFEVFNESDCTFNVVKGGKIQLEHSLLSISKWEAKWHKPFLGIEQKTPLEVMDYVKCMTINNIPDILYSKISNEQYALINKYINDPMTATTIKPVKGGGSREIMTSELIYYSMFTNNIPKDCEKWHINRLLTLIKVFNIKSQPPKKKSQQEILRDQAALNAARKKKLNTKG